MAFAYDPIASKENVVAFGNARFSILTSRMVRLEYAADGVFEDRPTLKVVNRKTVPVQFTKSINNTILSITTEHLALQYKNDGAAFSARNLSISLVDDKKALWKPGKKDPGNLGGTFRTLDCMKGDRPVVKWHPLKFGKGASLGTGLVSRNGWSVIEDSDGIVLDKLADGRWWIKRRDEGIRLDWYFFGYGHDYKQAVFEGQQVFGRQPLPPRYTLGYWWSRYWAYTDKELENLVAGLEKMGVPLDILVVDMDWHLDGWTGYTWDRNYFPDPDQFMRWAKSKGLKLSLNLHPAEGVGKQEDQFKDMALAMGLDPAKVDRVPFDCVDPKYMDAYFKYLHHPYEDKGIDFWWMDWQQGQKSKMEGLDPLVWLNFLHWDDMQKRSPARRPLIFSRFGGIGSGRNPIGFSGDTFISWESLAFQPYFTSTAGNVLYGYWSHDIGGHAWGKTNGELYLRWVQFGRHSPILRTHATKGGDNDRRFWLFGEPYTTQLIEEVRKRYELVPYIYTENRKCMETGISLCHPLYYEHPDEKAAYAFKNEYCYGEKMIVSPVVAPVDQKDDMASAKFWLPHGEWIDTAYGDLIKSGTHTRRYTLWDIPVFVKPGTVIVGQKTVERLLPGSYRDLVVTAYPGEEGSYSLYEDDGISQAYQNGGCAWLTVQYRKGGAIRTIKVDPIKGAYEGMDEKRTLEVRMPFSAPPTRVLVDGREIPWSYEPNQDTWGYNGDEASVVIRVSSINVRKGAFIQAESNPGFSDRQALGIKGMITRCKAALQIAHSIGYEERAIAGFAQLGNRLSRNPKSFADETRNLKRDFSALKSRLVTVVNQISKDKKRKKYQLVPSKKVAAIISEAVKELLINS
jgi:alpha-glucosidase (family GH31 glycosyl hydrolase)